MSKKVIYIVSVIAIVGASAVFYGGMIYGEKRQTTNRSSAYQNLTPEERQKTMQGFRNGGEGRGGALGQSGFVSGEVISKDDKSITVRLRDSGSKIVFFSNSTNIGKSTVGSMADLEIGKQVTVNGSVGSDGSLSAESIQIRSEVPSTGQINTPPAPTKP